MNFIKQLQVSAAVQLGVLVADTSITNLSARQKLPAGSEVLLGGKLELMKCGCSQNIKFHQVASQRVRVKFY